MDRKDVLEAAHTVWASYWGSEIEEKGGSFPPGAILNDLAPRLDERKLLPVLHDCLYKIDEAVEKAVGKDRSTDHASTFEQEVDDHIPAEDQERYLMLVVMGCLGHGISPGDDWELPEYLEHPCDIDDSPWHELAFDSENLGQPGEVYAKDGNKCPVCGSVVHADDPVAGTREAPGLRHDGEDVGATVATANCWCDVCKSRWVDQYKLVGYSDLEIGAMK